MDIQNKKIPEDIFHQMRQEVLTQWPTGKDVDLQEAVDYHKAMPKSRDFGAKLLEAKAAGRTLVQPRAGVPVVDDKGQAHYSMTPGQFAAAMVKLVKAGASIIGGCCGTGPEFIAAMKREVHS